jgi:hypothetical protein
VAAIERAREDRLQRAVVIFGGDDVARHQRRDQRKQPDRPEQQQHQRHRQARLAHVAAEGDVVGRAVLKVQRRHE